MLTRLLALVTGLPSPVFWGAGILLALAGAWIGHTIDVRAHEKKADSAGYARAKGEWDAAEKVRAETAAKAEAANRAEEQRRRAAEEENRRVTEVALSQARADAAGAVDAAVQLRQHVAWLLTRSAGGGASGDPSAAVGRAATGDTAGMLADVLGQCTARVQRLAEIADVARVAGSACERAYDALTPN